MALQPPRDFRPLHRAILRGEAGKKVLFQPRIDCWYHDRIFRDKTLQPPYEGLSRHDLYCALDVSPRLYEFNACFESYDLVPVERTWTRLSPLEVEQRIVTPVGTVSNNDDTVLITCQKLLSDLFGSGTSFFLRCTCRHDT